MNKDNLRYIFQKYIDNFETINNKEHDENFKWELAEIFQTFDIDSKYFANMLYDLWKKSDRFIDNRYHLGFYALYCYAKEEPETVRSMFKKLFEKEFLTCEEKQNRIDEFIAESEKLWEKYLPQDLRYKNNQKSVMTYLFYRYPNSNYLYRAKYAKDFAGYIEFYDTWGPMTNFKLEPYVRMCDLIVDEIKNNENLIKTHMSRYNNNSRNLHNDINYHILATDIIYSSQIYGFITDLPIKKLDAKARDLYLERCSKAKELDEIFEKAEADYKYLLEAQSFIASNINQGNLVTHKLYGEGKIEDVNSSTISVNFPKNNKNLKFGLMVAIGNNILKLSEEGLTDNFKKYIPILNRERDIPRELARAKKELEPYLEYLD
jgi:hypothetical protein